MGETKITMAILAGGKSSRFKGLDKQEILVDGEKLGRIAAKNALSAARPLIVVGRNRSVYDGLPVTFTDDIRPGFGPLSGLHAALKRSESEWLYLMACDMPFFSLPWLESLRGIAESGGAERKGGECEGAERKGGESGGARRGGAECNGGAEHCPDDLGEALAIVARSGRHVEPFHALYSRLLIPRLEMIFDESPATPRQFSFSRLIGEVPHRVVPEAVARTYSPDWKLFYSVNSPDDLAVLEAIHGRP